MEALKLHAGGASTHLESIKDVFESYKKQLKSDTTLPDTEKEIQLVKAKDVYLEEKKSLKINCFDFIIL